MYMKKIIVSIVILIFIISINVYASNGPVKQDSIIECNGTYYGKHSSPAHWHVVKKINDKWVSVGSEVELPPCYIKKPNEKEKVQFSKCSDGDTAWFVIKGESKKVRFLAIDTPEIGDNPEPFGKEASDFTCKRLKSAKNIVLEYDGASDKEDKYGRILAFVWFDGKLLEKELIDSGFAKVAYIYGDYEHITELREAEELAKGKKIGIWSIDRADTTLEDDISDSNELVKLINLLIDIIKKIIALLFD